MPSTAPALGFVSILLVASSGCSFLFTTQAPSDAALARTPGPFECTTSRAAPVLDTISAGFDVARLGIALTRNDSDYADQPLDRSTEIALSAGFAALYTASAIYGYTVTARCSAVKQERLRAPLLPPGGNPGPYVYPPPRYPPPGYPPPNPSAPPSSASPSSSSPLPQTPVPAPTGSAPAPAPAPQP